MVKGATLGTDWGSKIKRIGTCAQISPWSRKDGSEGKKEQGKVDTLNWTAKRGGKDRDEEETVGWD